MRRNGSMLQTGGSWSLNARLSRAKKSISATCVCYKSMRFATRVSNFDTKKTPIARDKISIGPKGSKMHPLFLPKRFVDAVFPTQTLT